VLWKSSFLFSVKVSFILYRYCFIQRLVDDVFPVSYCHNCTVATCHVLVISPEMTSKTGQVSIWADVNETWHVYFMGLWTQLVGSGILNFSPCCAMQDHLELSPAVQARKQQPICKQEMDIYRDKRNCSMSVWLQTSRKLYCEFWHLRCTGYPELSLVGRDDPPRAGCLFCC